MFSDKNEFKESFLKRIEMSLGKAFPDSTKRDQFHILGNMIREHISTNWIQTNEHYRLNQKSRCIIYP